MRKVLFMMMFLAGSPLAAQDETHIVGQQGYLRLMPVYQQVRNEDGVLAQFSTAVHAYWPIARQVGISLLARQATAAPSFAANFSGFSDPQLGLNYYLPRLQTLLNFKINMPGGATELTSNEFAGVVPFSTSVFDFQVPGFGQGLNLAVGFSSAYAAGEKVVLGLGVSYQRKGAYRPLAALPQPYDPGNELLFTAGVDIAATEATSLSADVILTRYGVDRIGETAVFEAGAKTVLNVLLRRSLGGDALAVLFQWRSRSRNQFAAGGSGRVVQPDEIGIESRFTTRVRPVLRSTFSGEWRRYADFGPGREALDIFRFGVFPEILLHRWLALHGRLRYLTGNGAGALRFTGWEAGLGLQWTF